VRALKKWADRRAHLLAGQLTVHGARLRLPLVTAIGWALRSRPLRVPGTVGRRTRGRRIALLPKVGGTEDVRAAFSERGCIDIGLLRLDRYAPKEVYSQFLDDPLDDFDYRPHDHALAANKLAYRRFLARTCRHYCRLLGIRAFIVANIGYVAERELAGACEDLGVPLLALHKESIRTAAQRPIYEQGLIDNVGPFTGRAVAVYNEEERRSMIRTGIVDAARIEVVGCPRADVQHARRRMASTPSRRSVVYFAIDPLAGNRTFGPASEQAGHDADIPRWCTTTLETERALVAWAAAHPDVTVHVKAKFGHTERVRDRFSNHEVPDNMTIHYAGVGTDLIDEAHVVIGLNTTALLEAVAAGRHAVVPLFGEAAEPSAEPFLFELGTAVSTVDSASALGGAIDRALGLPLRTELDDAERRLLDRYIGNPDGAASDRAYAWILRESGLAR
jgi:hypothetical protein